jgi:hypothetical protein
MVARVISFSVACVLVLASSACVDDSGCELLGQCVDGACHCLPGFVGPTCGVLDLLPVSSASKGRVWPEIPSPSAHPHTMAWSFAPFQHPSAGTYHAVVEVGCGPTWNEGFHLAMLSSDKPDGGFKFNYWLSPYRVNSPHLLVLKNGSVVLHFQTGRVQWPPNTSALVCSGSNSVNPPIPSSGVPLRACGLNESALTHNCLCFTLTPKQACVANIHVANSPSFLNGSWDIAPVTITGAGWNPFNATVPNIGESNPAVAPLQDGRALISFRSHLKGGYWPGVEGEHMGFAIGSRYDLFWPTPCPSLPSLRPPSLRSSPLPSSPFRFPSLLAAPLPSSPLPCPFLLLHLIPIFLVVLYMSV